MCVGVSDLNQFIVLARAPNLPINPKTHAQHYKVI